MGMSTVDPCYYKAVDPADRMREPDKGAAMVRLHRFARPVELGCAPGDLRRIAWSAMSKGAASAAGTERLKMAPHQAMRQATAGRVASYRGAASHLRPCVVGIRPHKARRTRLQRRRRSSPQPRRGINRSAPLPASRKAEARRCASVDLADDALPAVSRSCRGKATRHHDGPGFQATAPAGRQACRRANRP